MSDETKTEAYKARARAVFAELLRRDGWMRLDPAPSIRWSFKDGLHECAITFLLADGISASIYKYRRPDYSVAREPQEIMTLECGRDDPLALLAAGIRERLADPPVGEADFAEVERLVGIAPRDAAPAPDGA